MNDSDSDALVFFGATGDLAYKKPAHYLAIPPVLFGLVVEQLGKSNCTKGARVIVEKPFGTDLASARGLNRILLGTFPEQAIFRIDHFLGKRPVNNVPEDHHVVHRPLSWQAAGEQRGGLPVCERIHGAVLESKLHRERADHHG